MRSIKSSTKLQVVVDTNVFVSAFIWGGNPKSVIQKWLEGNFELLLSPFLLTEILLVLKRFCFDESDLRRLKNILENNALKFIPKRKVSICRGKKDNQILALCFAGKADYLVTGDRDLLTIKKRFHHTLILTPKKFLEILRRQNYF